MECDMVGVICKQCGSKMKVRTRRSDGAQFYGCSSYPTCQYTQPFVEGPTDEDGPTEEFKASEFQQAIFDYIQDPDGTDAVVEAVPGSGKTTTLVQALQYTSGRVLMVAFNKRIAVELATRVPAGKECSTFHSMGFRVIRDAFPHKPIVDQKKKEHIAKELLPSDRFSASSALIRLVSLMQACLVDGNDRTGMINLINHYDIDVNDDEPLILALAPKMIEICATRTTVIDFDDMIWLPVIHNLPCKQYDWIFVDEAQDMNKVQTRLILNSIDPHGRIIAVGDRFQSIYGFRGADTEAIPNLIGMLNDTKVLPLSITYRCPVSHVKLARRFVSEIQPADWAEMGEVHNGLSSYGAVQRLQSGDMVLCRVNAPLVKFCYMIIRTGKKAMIVGRDIGDGLVRLIDKMKSVSVEQMLAKLKEYSVQEQTKFLAAGKDNRARALADRVECINALCEGVQDLTELKSNIGKIFTDEIEGIALSSVHRAKGLEADNVFILEPEKMVSSKAQQEWQIQQEYNICYVALTRAKKSLSFIGTWAGVDEDPADDEAAMTVEEIEPRNM